MHPIRLAGEPAHLHPAGALFLPARDTLLVADAHFGKAVSYRRLGVPVPEATTGATLDALSDAIAATAARRIVFLGDFLHSRRSHARETLAALQAWRDRHPSLDLLLVRGNHDARAGDPPASLGIEATDEPVRLGPFALCHHPDPVAGAYVLAGHWHPCTRIGGRAFDSLRLPCFWLGDDSGAQPQRAVGVLPAFGSFTGMHPIRRAPGDRVFAIADGVVRPLPGA
ncbi:ligase-associated DNA damage response endonuclease PdeM [Ramlibacter sp.]|uniref:ligase-associated DNA damage response endonuclease PdeM n=1 Tax=Ramlibacter sp. TaxID=1917967 RepID=UPI002D3D3F45|nr:ligase-associated DNA damage response endonuclease PdeM [Ramlibacter sp.]HYD77496.1 ligase-associated DNA damage response endonuclease PdeM [Ramlibacter sp.]